MIHIQSGMKQGFFTLIRTAHNLKLINCLFLAFSILYFQIGVTETMGNETVDKGRLLYILEKAIWRQ